MKTSIQLLGISATFDKLSVELKTRTDGHALKKVSEMTAELSSVTPVDTGNARDSWSYSRSFDGFVVRNTAPYIHRLNEGSSKQAPAYFVERTALKYGLPLGTIVSKIP